LDVRWLAAIGGLVGFIQPFPASSQIVDMRYEVLAPDEKAIVDRMAAEFFEDELRPSQSYAIERKTAELYVGAAPAERARILQERRRAWDEMSGEQREALKHAARPSFSNLAEEQKTPYRSIALDRLEAEGAIDADALLAALKGDV
jgi:hypothetical protein